MVVPIRGVEANMGEVIRLCELELFVRTIPIDGLSFALGERGVLRHTDDAVPSAGAFRPCTLLIHRIYTARVLFTAVVTIDAVCPEVTVCRLPTTISAVVTDTIVMIPTAIRATLVLASSRVVGTCS
jgi:hypothetical protein